MSIATDNFFAKLIRDLLPTRLRKPRQQAWLLALLKPVRDMHDEFTAYKPVVAKKLKQNGQAIMFEHFLNEEFPAAGGIQLITEAKQNEIVMIGLGNQAGQGFYAGFGTAPSQGVFVGLPAAYNYDYDFIVQLPAGANINLAKLQSLIKQFKLAGKRFIIRKGSVIAGSGSTLDQYPAANYNVPTEQ